VPYSTSAAAVEFAAWKAYQPIHGTANNSNNYTTTTKQQKQEKLLSKALPLSFSAAAALQLVKKLFCLLLQF